MAKMGPILLGLGAAFLLMRKKGDGAGEVHEDHAGFGTGAPGGTSACHILDGIWAPSQSASASPLSEITSNQRLAILPLTKDGFLGLDQAFQKFFEANPTWVKDNSDVDLAADGAALYACRELTDSAELGCSWKTADQTPRMKQLYAAARVMYKEGIKPGGMFAPFIGG